MEKIKFSSSEYQPPVQLTDDADHNEPKADKYSEIAKEDLKRKYSEVFILLSYSKFVNYHLTF